MQSCTVKKLLDLPFYTEGPAMDAHGNFYFTALTGGFIGKIDREGVYTRWSEGNCPNGQAILENGVHLFCDSREPGIAQYDSSGNFSGFLIKNSCAETSVQSPNDLVMDANGNLYFTDSVRGEGKVFFRSAAGRECVVARNIDYANGLVLSHNERFLYVAESYQNRILVVELTGPGVAGNEPRVFADLPRHKSGDVIRNLPDGLAIDTQGRIWVAHYGMQAIQVLSAEGQWLFSIDTTLPLTSNLHFVQDEQQEQKLLVTGGYGEPGPGAVLLVTVCH